MLTTNADLINIISERTSLKALPQVVLEYNMNEMAGAVAVVGNHGTADDASKILFPADSVISPFRPSKSGVKYGILGVSTNLTTYKTKDIPASRTYMIDKDLPYSYFLTKGSGSVTLSYFEDNLKTVPQSIVANKIVVTIENGYSASQPTVAIGSLYTGTVPASGSVTIGWNGTAWVVNPTSYSTTNVPTLSSLTVSLSNVVSYAGIIEVSPRYVTDITSRVVGLTINKDDSIKDQILPVGMLTANSASMQISTISSADIVQFIKGDAIDVSKIMLSKNVKFTIFTNIEDTYSIQQGVFYINEFSSGDYGSYSITGLDAAKFLQETKCPELIIEDSSFQAIVWRMLDSVGFVDYDFTECTSNILKCSYWWSDGNKTVWQAIQELCRETQTIAFFDELGKLKFVDRNSFYNKNKSVDWTFRFAADGNKKPDIISSSLKQNPSTTDVKINYNIPTTSTLVQSSQPLWTEQAPSTLFAAPFQGNEYVGDGVRYIKYPGTGIFSDIIPTRFNSYVLIDSEIIEYDAIQFSTPDNASIDVESVGQYSELRAKYNNNMAPTGKLRVKKRGALGTTEAIHLPGGGISVLSGWDCKKTRLDSPLNEAYSIYSIGINYRNTNNMSALGLSGSTNKDDLFIISKSFQYADEPISQIGTSVGFGLINSTNVSISQRAGMVISWNASARTGYIILIDTVRSAQNSSRKAEMILAKVVNGVTVASQRVQSNIFENQFYPLDVMIERSSNKNVVYAVINGSNIKLVDEANPIPNTGVAGLVVGGQSTAYFDYFYNKKNEKSQMDLVNTRSVGKLIASGLFTKLQFQQQNSSSNFEYLEFGTVLREIYNAKPTYQQAYPVLAEASNPLAQVVGARLGYIKGDFFIFNTSSSSISIADSAGRTVGVYGITISNTGQNTFETEKDSSRLKETTTFDLIWVQDVDSAKSLSDFLVQQWSRSVIDIDLDVFGNPLLQVGDIVNVIHPELNLSSSTKFVIKSINHNIEYGIDTKVSLRSIYAG